MVMAHVRVQHLALLSPEPRTASPHHMLPHAPQVRKLQLEALKLREALHFSIESAARYSDSPRSKVLSRMSSRRSTASRRSSINTGGGGPSRTISTGGPINSGLAQALQQLHASGRSSSPSASLAAVMSRLAVAQDSNAGSEASSASASSTPAVRSRAVSAIATETQQEAQAAGAADGASARAVPSRSSSVRSTEVVPTTALSWAASAQPGSKAKGTRALPLTASGRAASLTRTAPASAPAPAPAPKPRPQGKPLKAAAPSPLARKPTERTRAKAGSVSAQPLQHTTISLTPEASGTLPGTADLVRAHSIGQKMLPSSYKAAGASTGSTMSISRSSSSAESMAQPRQTSFSVGAGALAKQGSLTVQLPAGGEAAAGAARRLRSPRQHAPKPKVRAVLVWCGVVWGSCVGGVVWCGLLLRRSSMICRPMFAAAL